MYSSDQLLPPPPLSRPCPFSLLLHNQRCPSCRLLIRALHEWRLSRLSSANTGVEATVCLFIALFASDDSTFCAISKEASKDTTEMAVPSLALINTFYSSFFYILSRTCLLLHSGQGDLGIFLLGISTKRLVYLARAWYLV